MLIERFGRCSPAEDLAGPVVHVVATASISSADQRAKSVPFGEVLAAQAVAVSFVPRCQGLCGSAKNTGRPVSILNWACADISLPRSQVSDRRSYSGSAVIVGARALFIVIAP